MIHAGRKSRPYDLGCRVRARTRFLLPRSTSASLGRRGRYFRLSPCITRQNYVNRLGTGNVRGINGTAKREDVVDVFKEGRFELFALKESKLKGKGEVTWCGVNGIIADVRRWKELGKGWPSC